MNILNQRKIKMAADSIIFNGTIYTENPDNKIVEAVAIKNGLILAVGSNEEIKLYQNETTKLINLNGKIALPGFFDGHMHPAKSAVVYVFSVIISDVSGVKNYLKKIKDFADSHDALSIIDGVGFYRSDFDELGPRKELLDEIDMTRPIIITSVDFHSVWVNSKALEMAKITKNTPNPEGGVIKKDPVTGEPSGLLQESAMNLINDLRKQYTKDEYKEAIIWLQKFLNSKGITNIFDANVPLDKPNYYEAYEELAQEEALTIRIQGAWGIKPEMGPAVSDNIDKGIKLAEKFTTPYFKIKAFKFFADQVIEEEAGLLLEPYTNRQDAWLGMKVWDNDEMIAAFKKVDENNFQIHVHVIGDGAAKYTLDALETVRKINGVRDSRHTFAHCQLMSSADKKRLAEFNMTAVVAPYWMIVDDYFWNIYYPYLGIDRCQEQYPYKTLITEGINTTIHSDFLITEPDYALAFYSAQTRRMAKDKFAAMFKNTKFKRTENNDTSLTPNLFSDLPNKDERVSLAEVIKSATINGAIQVFEENNLGSIEIGKSADFAIFDKDFNNLDLEDYYKNPCVMTIFEGKVVYSGRGLKS